MLFLQGIIFIIDLQVLTDFLNMEGHQEALSFGWEKLNYLLVALQKDREDIDFMVVDSHDFTKQSDCEY